MVFKKEYFFVFVIAGLAIVYGILTAINFIFRGRSKKVFTRKLAIGTMIVVLTTIVSTGSFAQDNSSSDGTSGNQVVAPVYAAPVPTSMPMEKYGAPFPTKTPKPTLTPPIMTKYGGPFPTPTVEPQPVPEYGAPAPTATVPPIMPLYAAPTPTATAPVIIVPDYAAPTPTPPLMKYGGPFPRPELGDVNNDKSVDIIDSLYIARHYVGMNPQPYFEEAGDVNKDGATNIVDALLIAKKYVGEIKEFPGESSEKKDD